MYTDVEELPELKVNMTFGKFVMIIASVFIFLVLPIQVITTYFPQLDPNKSQETENIGRVAGASTDLNNTSELKIPILNDSIDLNSQDGVFTILGMVLIGIAVILIVYLILESRLNHS